VKINNNRLNSQENGTKQVLFTRLQQLASIARCQQLTMALRHRWAMMKQS